MNPEEIMAEVQSSIDLIVSALVNRSLERLTEPDSTELSNMIVNSKQLRNWIYGYFERRVATEVGNRLRCGIWNAPDVDKIFDAVWTEQYQRAIEDRIRSKVNNAIDTVIAERLKKLI